MRRALRPADYLTYYAQHFDAVEVDSTALGYRSTARGSSSAPNGTAIFAF